MNFVFLPSLQQGHQPVQKETYHPCLDTTVENLLSFRLSHCIFYCVHSLLCHTILTLFLALCVRDAFVQASFRCGAPGESVKASSTLSMDLNSSESMTSRGGYAGSVIVADSVTAGVNLIGIIDLHCSQIVGWNRSTHNKRA